MLLVNILLEWLDRAITEIPVESLPNEQVLALCDLQMQTDQQEVLTVQLPSTGIRLVSNQMLVSTSRITSK